MKYIHLSMIVALFACVPALSAEKAKAVYEQQQDVIYGDVHGTALVMDIFTPTGKRNGIGIVDVASGAWHSDRGKIRDHARAGFYDVLCGRGYVVFAVRPGSISKYSGKEMLSHVKRGIRFVKYHAGDYEIDPDRLGITGASAGGHLASLTAVTGDDGNADAKDPLRRLSTRVVAAAVFFPPTQFLKYGDQKPDFNRIGGLFFPGGLSDQTADEVEAAAKAMSPALQVTAEAPPFLFIHGDADPLVPLQQSKVMIAALKKVGVSAELIVKPGGGHAWPTIREEVVKLADWFDKQFAKKNARR